MNNFKVDEWIYNAAWNLGAGEVTMDLGAGMLRVRYAGGEGTVRTAAVRRATKQEIEAAQKAMAVRRASR